MKSLFWTEITWLHRLAAGPKLAAMCLLGSGLILVGDLRWLAVGCFLTSMAYLSLGVPAVRHLRHLRGAVVAAALVAVSHAALGAPGAGAAGALRLLTAILLATMFTVTTRFDDLLDVLENLLRPLRILGVPTGRLALALALALRFIDVFHASWQRTDDAHRARTGRAGGWRLLAPLTLRTLQTADRVADALNARLGR